MLERIQTIPRYYVYLLLAAVVIWQVLFPINLPIVPSAPTRGVIDAIKSAPDDKLIIISTDWDASTQAETGPQTKAIIEACFQNHKRFAIMNLSPPAGVKLANDIAKSVAKRYHARYGRDWCNWGYKIGNENVLLAMQKNIPRAVGKDFNGTLVTELPMMRGVESIRDIGLVILVTGYANLTEYWVGLIQTPFNIPMATGYTAVMAPGYYSYLDSGQLQGILVGAKGAAEMESAIGQPDAATAIMNVQSWAHLLIIALIILGNVGQTLARKSSAQEARR